MKQSGNPSERQLEIAHDTTRTEDHDQDEDDPEDDLARPIERRNGDDAKVKDFACKTYKVEFDLFSKVKIKGNDAAPLYKFLTDKGTNPQFGGDIEWNFAKFLINREGQVVARSPAAQDPSKPEVVQVIERELAAK